MPLDWVAVRDRFDPLTRPDPREIPRLYVQRPRGMAPNLIDFLRPGVPPRTCLLIGQRSSGKTTELLRVMEQLQEHYGIVFVDLGAILPLQFGILDVLFGLGAALYRAAEENAPGQLRRQLYMDLIAAMGKEVRKWSEERKAEVSFPKLAQSLVVLAVGFVAGPGVAQTVGKAADAALKALNLKASETTEAKRTFEQDPQPGEVLRCLTALIEALENSVARRPILLMADGLDFVPPALAAQVASREDILAAIPCRVAMVAPPDLRIALDAPALGRVGIAALPNLPVTGPRGEGELPGETLGFFEQLISRRLPESVSRTDLFDDEQLALLARSSGGVIRDCIRLVYYACDHAAQRSLPRVDRACLDESVARVAGEYGPRAEVATVSPLLEQVKTTHKLPGGPEALNLIHHNLVLLYAMGQTTWYDVHPLVRLR